MINLIKLIFKLKKSGSGGLPRRPSRPAQPSGRGRGAHRGFHQHQKSAASNMMVWSMNQNQPNAFTSSFSPGPLTPPQTFHKRAASFDPHLIHKTPCYTSVESINSQIPLHRPQVKLYVFITF